jgi:putative MATE family efflux protein
MIKALKDKQFLSRFFAITFPVMLHSFISFIVNFVDNIMVGAVSNEAVSAVFSVNQASFFFFVVTYGIFSGASVYVQQFSGSKDKEHLRQAFRYKLVIGTIFLLLMVPLFLFAGKYLVAYYARSATNMDVIIELAAIYLPFVVASFIPFIYAMAYSSTMREIGKTKIPMITGSIALVINAILNAVFIYGLNMGVMGAGLATLIARIIEFIALIFVAHYRKEAFCHRIFVQFKIEKKLGKMITFKMWPLLINEILWSAGMILQSLSYAERTDVLSAMSILWTTTEIFGIVFAGLAIGIGVMVGSTLGANEIEKAKETIKKLLYIGILISLFVGGIMIISSPYIPLLWVEVDPQQQQLATQLIIVYAAFLSVYSIGVSSYHTLRAGGKSLQTMLIDSGLMWLGTVPLAWILALLTNLPLIYIFISLQSIDIIKMLIGLYLIKKGKWANNLTLKIKKKEVLLPL